MVLREGSGIWRVLVIWSMFSCASLILAAPECGGHVKIIYLTYGQSGSIRSPNYPSRYESDEDCKWLIVAPYNQKVLLFFTSIDLEDRCSCDYVKIFDGSNDSSTNNVTKVCGNILPLPVYSSNKYLYMTFRSDSSGQRKGFVAHYRALRRSSGCPLIDPVATAGVIYSPNFPWDYPHSASCNWKITVPSRKKIKLNFIRFNLERSPNGYCSYDYVRVRYSQYDNGRKFCGTVSPSSITTNGFINVIFRSDRSISRSGFMAFYQTGDSFPTTSSPYTTNPYYTRILPAMVTPGPRYDACKPPSNKRIFVGNSSSSSIASPNYKNVYHTSSPKTTCSWNIATAKGYILQLTFDEMSISSCSSGCSCGKVQIYENVKGGKSSSHSLLGTFCSGHYPSTVTSKGNQMSVKYYDYHSCDSFKATVTSMKECSGSVKNISLTNGGSGSIRSPNYPSSYGNDEDCKWLIAAPDNQKVLLYFTSIDLEDCCSCDYVKIFDGSSDSINNNVTKGCGNILPLPIYSSDKYLFMTFRSDSSGQRKGFVAHYRALNRSSGCPLIDPVATAGVIYSPNFPWNYPRYALCSWTITVPYWKEIKLNFIHFNLETFSKCIYDYVRVRYSQYDNGRKFCGTVIPSSITTNGSIYITFRSDHSISRSGFMAFYQTGDSFPTTSSPYTIYPDYTWRPTMATPGPHYDTSKPSSNKKCSGSVKNIDLTYEQSGSIRSPNYPSSYGSDEDCKWLIGAPDNQKVLLYFTSIDLEDCCICDYVKIFDVWSNFVYINVTKACGNILPPPVYSSNKYLYMTFRSDISGQRNEFVAHYRALNKSSGCPFIDPVATAGVIYSPNFPWNYSYNTVCDWTITVPSSKMIKLNFIRFNLERSPNGYCYDYVRVRYSQYDNGRKFCGTVIPSSITTSGSINVTFRSDSIYSYSGFMAFYQTGDSFPTTASPYAGPHYDTSKLSSNKTQTVDAAAFAVPIVIAVVLFLIIFAVIKSTKIRRSAAPVGSSITNEVPLQPLAHGTEFAPHFIEIASPSSQPLSPNNTEVTPPSYQEPLPTASDPTSFPGSLFFPAPGGGKKRDPGNEVASDPLLFSGDCSQSVTNIAISDETAQL